uniref:Serine/threonine-protein phosphatase 2A activator n=1 Tax=Oncorhynchus kisutch TaxID=8019 RepID=A0A8C7L7Z2_ONCKI
MRSNTEQIPLNIYSSGSSPEDDTPHIPVDQTFMVLPTYDLNVRRVCFGVVLGFYVFMFSFQPIEKLLALLETLDRSIDETPPADQLSRLGDKAYCAWYAKLDQEAEALVAAVFPENKAAATPEIAVYLKEAAGNSRIYQFPFQRQFKNDATVNGEIYTSICFLFLQFNQLKSSVTILFC